MSSKITTATAQATPASLLERLRSPDSAAAWELFVQLYSPLLYHWARRLGLTHEAAGDLVQDVFTVLVQRIPDFTYDPDKRFRAWLWTVTVNKLREQRRRRAVSTQPLDSAILQDQAGPDTATPFDEEDYRRILAGRALQLIQAEFQPTTWKAFWEHVTHGRPAADVAAELGLSVGAVYAAKVRVLGRLREELSGLLD